MTCSLYKFTKETPTHYIGSTGKEYPINDYMNWGNGETKQAKKDLPMDEYPYTYKYKTELKWKCCQICSCKNKKPLP